MGTAGHAFPGGDPNEKKLVDELNNLLEGKPPVPGVKPLSDDEKKGLERAFRKAVQDAIFSPGADAITKANVSQAVQDKVMDDMLRKYKDWKDAGGQDPWPFKK